MLVPVAKTTKEVTNDSNLAFFSSVQGLSDDSGFVDAIMGGGWRAKGYVGVNVGLDLAFLSDANDDVLNSFAGLGTVQPLLM